MNRRFLTSLIVSFLTVGASAPAMASEPVVLTIDGKTRTGQAVEFTLPEIERMGLETIRTSTPWHAGVETFEGVRLSKLMEEVGAEGDQLFVVALNQYTTEIPMSDVKANNAILAIKRDGKFMEVDDKGPLFVVYPFDDNPELKSELFYSRSAWQVRTITVE